VSDDSEPPFQSAKPASGDEFAAGSPWWSFGGPYAVGGLFLLVGISTMSTGNEFGIYAVAIGTVAIALAAGLRWGRMAYTLACAIPERIAAIASISGGMPLDEHKALMRCSDNKLAKPVSVVEIHGTADSFLPYKRGGDLGAPPTLDIVKHWATVDGCTGDPSVNQNGITKTTLWKHCSGISVVRLDVVTGGHSTWFGSTLDPVPGESDATVAVWDFFNSAH
jgi:poly(3-hydroxybutyrate) depolymerase